MALVVYDPLPFMKFFNNPKRVFTFQNLPNITIAQDWNSFGVAAVVWEAAIILMTYLQTISGEIKGKNILELGSGTGLCGIVASLLDANVTFTDLKDCLEPCSRNVKDNLNLEINQFQIRSLNWKEDLEENWSGVVYDYIIGADLVYIEDLFEDLIKTFQHFTKYNNNIKIFLSGKVRYKERYTKFKLLLEKHFDVELIAHDSVNDETYILKIGKLNDEL